MELHLCSKAELEGLDLLKKPGRLNLLLQRKGIRMVLNTINFSRQLREEVMQAPIKTQPSSASVLV